jgi:hypothetical protein
LANAYIQRGDDDILPVRQALPPYQVRLQKKSDASLRKYVRLGKVVVTREFSKSKKLYAFPENAPCKSTEIDMDFCEKTR